MLLAPEESRSYTARANAAMISGNYAQGLANRRKAAKVNPNDATAAFYLSWAEAGAGNAMRARRLPHKRCA